MAFPEVVKYYSWGAPSKNRLPRVGSTWVEPVVASHEFVSPTASTGLTLALVSTASRFYMGRTVAPEVPLLAASALSVILWARRAGAPDGLSP